MTNPDPIWWGVLFALLSCTSYTAAAVAQRHLATRIDGPLTGGGRLGMLLRHPLWWVSLLFNCGRAGFQVAAVSNAPLTVVQPLGVMVLVFGIPLSARVGGRRVRRSEWLGAALTVVSLGALLSVAVTSGTGGVLDDAGSLVVGGGTAVLLLATAWAAGRVPSARWRSYLLAGAAGVAFGVSSATTKTAVAVIAADGVAGLLHPSTLATPVIAVLGLLLSQAAYQGMDLGAPLGITIFANPAAATLVGIGFMGKSYAGGWAGAAVALVSALAAAQGVRLLTVTPRTAEDGRVPAAE
ncbi:DMT family transporter [Nocardiopsis algeriensis]|uniref:Drug/metabolite transporter (DMT)-like permease n=1 Tax=Nocardiopsis algeriensis TaxID=1478215 RepID=A0A841IWL4_9ACTN|nr:drug/metabolite transporter (DMT)-like permease [Nocardiopsis algeriensis]